MSETIVNPKYGEIYERKMIRGGSKATYLLDSNLNPSIHQYLYRRGSKRVVQPHHSQRAKLVKTYYWIGKLTKKMEKRMT